MTKAQLIRQLHKLEDQSRQAPQTSPPGELSETTEQLRLQTEHLIETQRLLEESRDRYADLFDFGPVGYLMLDPNGIINDLNLTACAMLGVERTIAVKRPLLLYVAGGDRRLFLNHMLRCRRNKGPVISELFLKTREHAQLPVQLSSRPAPDPVEAVTHYRTAITDLRERKLAEQKLRERERELENLNQTLEQRVEMRTAEAHQRVAQLRRLASELTHAEQHERRRLAQILHDHLQQILVAAKIQVGLAKNMTAKDAIRQSMAEADDLIKQSLDVSRWLTVELSPPVLFHADLATALEWAAQRTHQKYGLRIEVEADHDVIPADDDVRTLIFEAVRELLFNVVKHAGAQAMARVIMDRPQSDYLRVQVQDTGAGFDAGVLEPGKAEAGHFGLFSIRERLELLGGRMEIESRPGLGTRTMLLAPLKKCGVHPPLPPLPDPAADIASPAAEFPPHATAMSAGPDKAIQTKHTTPTK